MILREQRFVFSRPWQSIGAGPIELDETLLANKNLIIHLQYNAPGNF